MRRTVPFVGSLLVALLVSGAAFAVDPDEILPDAAMEARAREISEELRCLVCQNQSIDDSNAPLARDLRLLVRERLKAGDSNAQVLQFVEDRYGEFVLLRPPLSWRTALLWVAPLLALLIAVWVSVRGWRRRQSQASAAGLGAGALLTSDEEAKLREILGDGADGSAKRR